jgi:peptide subunit release factor 1 (eRF1)
MATDPITGIRVEEHESVFSSDLGLALREFARLPASFDVPYLTVYLDWRPAGDNPGVRPGRILMENQMAEILRRYSEEPEAHASLSSSLEQVNVALEEEIEPAVHGIVFIACAAHDIFEIVTLALPVETRVSVGPTPALLSLARVVEDNPRYAVLLADQHDATLSIITRANRWKSLTVESNDYPRKQKQGGWSQRRYQARADERVSHFARGVADEVRRVLDEAQVDKLVIAGGEVFTSALNQELPESVKQRVIAEIRMDIRASEHDVIEATSPIALESERAAERAAFQAFQDALGSGAPAVSGPSEVLRALDEGRVRQLLISSDFQEEGWADFSLGLHGVGAVPAEHPAGGDIKAIVPVDLADEMVRLSLVTDAAGEIISPELVPEIEEHGGVAAILRF